MQPEDPADPQQSFLAEETQDEWYEARGLFVRTIVGFALLFAFVFLAFWWSGSAIRFGAARVTASNAPTYRVWGTVRDAKSGGSIPWAAIEDEATGNPPFFHSDADADGAYSLLTLAEPHRVRISAVGYRAVVLRIGKPWFVWWPRGDERHDIVLPPD